MIPRRKDPVRVPSGNTGQRIPSDEKKKKKRTEVTELPTTKYINFTDPKKSTKSVLPVMRDNEI